MKHCLIICYVIFDDKSVKILEKFYQGENDNVVDLTESFDELKTLTQDEALKKIETTINELIGIPLKTGTKPLRIQITKDNTNHIINTNVRLTKSQELRHRATLSNLKEIIKNAVKIDKDGNVDLSHNTKKRTIEHKKNIEKYIYFLGNAKAQTKDGIVYFDIEFTTEQIKNQNSNLLDLYHIKVKKQSQMPRLNDTLLNGSASNILTQNNKNVNRGESIPKPANTPINEQSKSIINILSSGDKSTLVQS